jgi:hypothetical protein
LEPSLPHATPWSERRPVQDRSNPTAHPRKESIVSWEAEFRIGIAKNPAESEQHSAGRGEARDESPGLPAGAKGNTLQLNFAGGVGNS